MATPPSGKTPHAPSAFRQRTGDEHLRRLGAYETNPEIEAVLRKMVRDVETTGPTTRTAAGAISVPDPAYMKQISGSISQDTTDATSLMQILPDMELIKNLLISSIMAPKDLVTAEVNISVDRRGFHLPVAGRMLEIITDYFTNVYNIKGLCPDILEQVLFLAGSYPLMVLPENSVDALINGTANFSTESFNTHAQPMFAFDGTYRSMGILGPGPEYKDNKPAAAAATKTFSSLESLRDVGHASAAIDPHPQSLGEYAQFVTITDNFNVAKGSALHEAKRRARIAQVTNPSFGLESGAANYALGGVQRRQLFGQSAMVQAVRTKEMLQRPMIGHPLVQHLPPESVIPVFITPKKHLGYFVIMDTEGHPISTANRRDIYNDLSTKTNGVGSGTNGASQMIQMAQNLSIGVNPQAANDPQQMVRIYGQLLEHDLTARLASGAYGEGGHIQAPEEVYQIMMARSLKRLQTQILYIPAELLCYVAFDYAENGTGRSLTERSKIIGSMRAMLTFSNVMGGIKNSVSRQKVTLQLSENDIDPAKTIARTMDEFTRRRNVTMPFIAGDPNDMISYINMAGVEFNVEGRGAPAHKVDVEDKVSNRAKVDVELDNSLRDRHYMSFGMTPETVLASTGADFAATVVTNNQMYAKRVISIQDDFTPFLETIVKMITRNSATLLNQLRQVVIKQVQDWSKQGAEDNPDDVVDKPSSSVSEANGRAAVEAVNAVTPAGNKEVPTEDELTEDQLEKINRIVFDFVEAIKVALPRPDTATLASQTAAFDAQSEALDKALSVEIDSAFMTDANLGEFAPHIDEVKAAYKAHLMRMWMRNNGYMPEVQEITAVDQDGNPEMDLLSAATAHANAVSKSVMGYLQQVGITKERIHKEQQQLDKQFPNSNLAVGGEIGDPGGSGGGGDFGGGGDMGGGDPGGMDDGSDEAGDGFGSGMPPDVAPAADPAAPPAVDAQVPNANLDTTGDDLSTGETQSGEPEEAERAEREGEEDEELEDEEKQLDAQGNPIRKIPK